MKPYKSQVGSSVFVYGKTHLSMVFIFYICGSWYIETLFSPYWIVESEERCGRSQIRAVGGVRGGECGRGQMMAVGGVR